MQVPIRVLGIATTVFWALLAVFIVLTAYSIKDLNIDIGEPQIVSITNDQLILSLPLKVDNKGFFSVEELHFSTVFSDVEGEEFSTADSFLPVVQEGEKITFVHNATLSISKLLEKNDQYLFNDNQLKASVTTGFNFAQLLPVQISTEFEFQWDAPFHNFALSKLPNGQSLAHSPMVLMRFENHATFDVVGSIRVELHDSTGSLMCQMQMPINVTRHSTYFENVQVNIPQKAVSVSIEPNSHFEVYFDTGSIEYGPLVIPYA
jgi:hypothetical protein